VDDATGKPFAYLSETAVLGAGDQEVHLQVFGKVALDAGAVPPFRVRDLEGFRLREDAFPDREAMPALDGAAYTTRRCRIEDLSPAEWESAANARRLSLLERAAGEARAAR
jgi:hypothetical protein